MSWGTSRPLDPGQERVYPPWVDCYGVLQSTYPGHVVVGGMSTRAAGVTRGVVVDAVRPAHGREEHRVAAALLVTRERQVRAETSRQSYVPRASIKQHNVHNLQR